MPTRVLRRTPTSEKAAVYSYKDLLKDSISFLQERARENVERMTSGAISNEELTEMALAPAGGMLKVAGTGKLLAGLLKRQAQFKKRLERGSIATKENIEAIVSHRFATPRQIFRESLKVPEREYKRIRGIDWISMKGEVPGTKGLYFPTEKDIALSPRAADIETVWHEFTHARQWNPEKYSKIPGEGWSETKYARNLRDLGEQLQSVAKEAKISPSQFYREISPVERHARGVAAGAVKFPKDFETIYRFALRKETADSRRRLHELLKMLEGEKAFMRGETEIQMSLRDIVKIPREAKSLMKTFSKQGLKYDAFTEPLPGYGYHQWTLYGEGPAKGATFGTKTTGAAEMEGKINELIRKFSE